MQGPTDFYDDLDNQQQFYSLTRLFSIPSFVKEASAAKNELDELPSEAFADPPNRKFPCHTKAATWLANAYFQHSKGYYDTQRAAAIQERITKAAEYFQIKSLCQTFTNQWEKVAGAQRPDLPDSAFGLVVDYEGKKQRLFPMPNVASVKMAGEYLFANRFKYPYTWRKQAARKILAKALEWDKKAAAGEDVPHGFGTLRFEPDTQQYLEKAAGFGGSLPQYVAGKIGQRVLMMKESQNGLRTKLAEIAVALNSQPPQAMETSDLEKIAEMVDAVDHETGIHKHYSNGVELPEEAFFQILQKEAQAVLDGHITLSTGNTYPAEAFSYIPLDKVAAVMGEDFKSEVSGLDGSVDPKKVAELAPTLPRGDAQLLERLLMETAHETLQKAGGRIKSSGTDPFSQEGMIEYFQKKGMKPSNLRFTLSVPWKQGAEK